jgi:hypothetical protein
MSLAPDIQQSILNKSRKDKFLLVLNLPPILKTINTSNQNARALSNISLDALQFTIHGVVVPKTTIPEVDLTYSTQTTKVTSYTRPPHDPVTVSFTVDNQFNNWWVLWFWLNVINNTAQGTTNYNNIPTTQNFKNIDNYQTNITIYGLDEYNNKKIQMDYIKAFITGLGEIVYDYRDGSLMESSFTFVFSQLNAQLL